jgi:hypothetical protein
LHASVCLHWVGHMKKKRSYSKLHAAGIICWGLMLIFLGTYLRIRTTDQVPTVDWVVFSQLLLAMIGTLIGLLLLQKSDSVPWGWGSIAMLCYILVTGLSALVSEYISTVIGYWILLIGGIILTMGLVKAASTVETLLSVESCWLLVINAILVKDVSISLWGTTADADGLFRLGTEVTNPVTMSFTAVLAFFISFRQKRAHSFIWWLVRLCYLFIIIASRTRGSMIAFSIGLLLLVWFHWGKAGNKGLAIRFAVVFGSVTVMATTLLGASFGSNTISTLFMAFTRHQDLSELMTLSARTEIWPLAFSHFMNNATNIVFGYGYNISRLVFLKDIEVLLFSASNAHNTFLEFLVGMGIFGAFSCFLLYIAGLQWLFRRQQLIEIFPQGFVDRATIIVILIILSSLSESVWAVKIDPLQLIYFYYIAAAERFGSLFDEKSSLSVNNAVTTTESL